MENVTMQNSIQESIVGFDNGDNTGIAMERMTEQITGNTNDNQVTAVTHQVTASADTEQGTVNTDKEMTTSVDNELKHAGADLDQAGEDISSKRTCTDLASRDISGPIVWATRRAALCESLPYYKSYKGSLYTNDKIPRGLYISDQARSNDKLTAEVIITTLGGGRVRDLETGQMTRVEDQTEKSTPFEAYTRAKTDGLILPVIAGKKHPYWSVTLTPKQNFCVLDHFQVTDIWAELNVMPKTGKAVLVHCVRLEKADLSKTSWWDPNPASYKRLNGPMTKRTCGSCNKEFKQIFEAGWTCLHSTCGQFFKDTNGDVMTSVAYSEAFLQERTKFNGDIPSVDPGVPDEAALNGINMTGSESIFRAGIVCPQCGCASSRRHWNHWSCESCPFELTTRMIAYPKRFLAAEVAAFDKKHKTREVQRNTDTVVTTKLDTTALTCRNLQIGPYKVSQFLLPDPEGKIIGSVTVFKATEAILGAGVNAMFDELSTKNIGLRRNYVTGGKPGKDGISHPNESWSRHFQQNWGAKYKFGVDVQSKGFDEAPDAILQAVHRLKWAGRTAVPMAASYIAALGKDGGAIHDANVEFNECLSLGYMKDDRIKFHDDGEDTCGPTVATLSLGSPAIMAFRPKKTPKKHPEWDMSKVVSEATLPKADGNYSELLKFPLYHGDMVLMHGSLIHRYYEHAVTPEGNRRFALTCRYMDPARMESNEARRQALIKGTLPARADAFVYKGDQHLGEDNPLQQPDDAPAADVAGHNTVQQHVVGSRAAIRSTPRITKYFLRSRKPATVQKVD